MQMEITSYLFVAGRKVDGWMELLVDPFTSLASLKSLVPTDSKGRDDGIY